MAGWRTALTVAAVTATTVVMGDLLLQRAVSLRPEFPHVDDGVERLAATDPYLLVIGSSHARSFLPLADLMSERSGGRLQGAVVTIEGGTHGAYEWVLQNRLRPLLDERDERGEPVRRNLRWAIIVTTYFDLCTSPHTLPLYGWQLRHYLADVAHEGLTGNNRNFVRARWKDLFSGSLLATERGFNRVVPALGDWVRPRPPEQKAAEAQSYLRGFTHNNPEFYRTCHDDSNKRALERMMAYFEERGVQVTFVLFPLRRDLVNATTDEILIEPYRRYVEGVVEAHGSRLVDVTYTSPMKPDDYMPDGDHMKLESNPVFSEWILDKHLNYLTATSGAADSHATSTP